MKHIGTAKRIIAWATVVIVLLAADLVTKLLAQLYLKPILPDGVEFLPGFIQLRYTENDAIAFGIGSGNRAFMITVTALTVVLIVAIAVLSFTVFKHRAAGRFTLAVIEAGAVGNLVDRLSLGYVRDFLDMSAFRPFAFLGSSFNFGVCNVADYFITIGAAVLIFVLLFIGPEAAFPLKKSWREQAKREEAEKHAKA